MAKFFSIVAFAVTALFLIYFIVNIKYLEDPTSMLSPKPVSLRRKNLSQSALQQLQQLRTTSLEQPGRTPLKQLFTTPAPRWKLRADGILRSKEEQQNEAVQILSLAVESSLAKHSRRLSKFPSGCDWTDGSWVKDMSIEYGKGILSNYMKCRVDYRQNCQRNNKDSPYIGYRWVLNDKNCETNRIRFTRQRFLEKIRNKKVAFVGDSLTRNMFQSLACLLYEPNDRTKMIQDYMYRYRYPDFGVTIEFIVSNYLVKQTREECDSSATMKIAQNPCIDVNQVDNKWAKRTKEFDILMFATGGWWEHDLQMRQASKGEKTYHSSKRILNAALRTVMDYLGRPEFKDKQLFWRCSEVSHFFGGEWNTGGTCRKDSPSNSTQYNAVSLFIQEAVIGALIALPSKINLLDITKMSSYRQDAHPSSQSNVGGRTDCKHWCLPGIPDHWNEVWLNMLP